MRGIIEADERAASLRGPGIQRRRLGGRHVGAESAEPDDRWTAPLTHPHGDAPGGLASADGEELGGHIRHRSLRYPCLDVEEVRT